MFLGNRVDDALSTYHLLDHSSALTLDQLRDAYRDAWTRELETEQAARGIDWHDDLPEPAAFQLGLDAIELAFAELRDRIGRPVAVQRRLSFTLAPGLDWTVECHLDFETIIPGADGEPIPAIVDYKVKNTPHTQARADRDPQAGLYLAGRWLDGQPARAFTFAQIAKPGARRKRMTATLVTTTRTTSQVRGILARVAQAASRIAA